MLFFPEMNGKTLSLSWSKKNHIGPEAKTQAQAQAQAEPNRPDGGGNARVGSSLYLWAV